MYYFTLGIIVKIIVLTKLFGTDKKKKNHRTVGYFLENSKNYLYIKSTVN